MKTLRELYDKVKADLEKASINEAEQDARLLIAEAFDLSPMDFALSMNDVLETDGFARLEEMVEKRCARVPMSQIFGEKEFWSLNFKVTSDTLTPRPDSETLIEACLKTLDDRHKNYRILDLGTGTGCLLLSLLSELKHASGIGIDVSQKALDVAKINAKKLALDDRAVFNESNWFANLNKSDQFDIIIANPPYIGLSEKSSLSPEVKDHEPAGTLFAGDDGLDDYKQIAMECDQYIEPEGFLVLEIGYKQATDVNEIFTSAGFNEGTLYQDLGNRDRCLIYHKRKILE